MSKAADKQKTTKDDEKLPNQTDEALTIEELLDEENERDRESVKEKKVQQYKHLKYVRTVVFSLIWLTFTVIMFVTKEQTIGYQGTVVPVAGKIWKLKEQPDSDMITVRLKAPFQELLHDIVQGKNKGNILSALGAEPEYKLKYQVLRTFQDERGKSKTEICSDAVEYGLVEPQLFDDLTLTHIQREDILTLNASELGGEYALEFSMIDVNRPLPLEIKTFPVAIKTPMSRVFSGLLIIMMFVIFFWDVVSRAIVAMLFSTLTIALLGIYHHREPLSKLLTHVDLDIILLVFGLTLIIAVLAETGGDVYVAVQFYRLSNGHIWPMLTVMCLSIAFGAAFLDSATILILITSLAIRLCEILQLNPTSVLTCLILFSNTGCMLTPTGLAQDSVLSQRGVIDHSHIFKGYGHFLLQMLLPVILSLILTYAYLRYYYGSSTKMRIVEPPIVSRLRNAIRFWSRTAQGMPGYTKEETVLRQNMLSKVHRLRQRLRRLGKMPVPAEDFKENLKLLQEQHKIRDRVLLIKCCIVLIGVIVMQIAHALQAHYLSPGWTCILFALILLALANWHDFDALMVKIDWSTLITIACLMIITRALQPLGLMDAIADSTVEMIKKMPRSFRLHTASILMLFMSALSAAFMNGQHVSYVMSTRAITLFRDADYNIDIDPMLFAVFLGTGFGANATLVSGISNIVCAGIAEKHGFKFYFYDFFKVGIVVTLGNIAVGIIYLLIFNAIMGYK